MKNKKIITGIEDAFPIFLGYMPLGLTLGITAKVVGFYLFDMFAMSAIVFAGSSQFIGVDLISKGISAITIIATTFFVNFRHFMMSSAYAPYLHGRKTGKLICVGAFITDETFAIAMNRRGKDDGIFGSNYIIALEITGYLSWILWTCCGFLVGSIIPSYENLGLEFALPAMFIGLIAAMCQTKTHFFVCIASGLLSTMFLLYGITNFNVIFSAIIVSFLVALIKRKEVSNA